MYLPRSVQCALRSTQMPGQCSYLQGWASLAQPTPCCVSPATTQKVVSPTPLLTSTPGTKADKNVSSYIARYPVCRTIQTTSPHPHPHSNYCMTMFCSHNIFITVQVLIYTVN